jgi:hypothetical protein
MSDGRTVVLGIVVSVASATITLLFSSIGLAWSIVVGLACLLTFVLALRFRAKDDRPARVVLGLESITRGPNERGVESALDDAQSGIDFWGVSANRTARSVSAQRAMLQVGTHGGRIRFLLLDPGCADLARRAADENEDAESWRKEIQSTVVRLTKFSDRNHLGIEIRYFATYPVWRYICIDSTRLRVNWFLPGKPGHHSPELIVAPVPDGLFWAFRRAFEDAWEAAREEVSVVDTDPE